MLSRIVMLIAAKKIMKRADAVGVALAISDKNGNVRYVMCGKRDNFHGMFNFLQFSVNLSNGLKAFTRTISALAENNRRTNDKSNTKSYLDIVDSEST